jgi:ParB family chromosome partitioning protein
VRKVEEMVKSLNNGDDTDTAKKKVAAKTSMPEEFTMLKNRLSDFFHTKVQLVCSTRGKGKISIPFSNEEELEHIMNVFDKLKN